MHLSVGSLLVIGMAALLRCSSAYRQQGSQLFSERLDATADIEGTINGERFRVEGKGYGNGRTGFHKGKFVSVDGDLPVSWSAAATTLGLGFECFARYPNGISDWRDWLKSTFPDGYTMERKIYFENDGMAKTRHRITYDGGLIRSNVRVHGEGFRRDGHVMTDNLENILPGVSYYAPDGRGGARSVGYFVFPVKDSDEFQVARQETYYKAIGGRGRRSNSRRFPYHLGRFDIKQSRDSRERRDHIIQEEIVEAYKINLLDDHHESDDLMKAKDYSVEMKQSEKKA